LIQKKQDLLAWRWKLVRNRHPYSGPKAYYPAAVHVDEQQLWLVYLTWTTLFVSAGIHETG
jgi:hypothetical protein